MLVDTSGKLTSLQTELPDKLTQRQVLPNEQIFRWENHFAYPAGGTGPTLSYSMPPKVERLSASYKAVLAKATATAVVNALSDQGLINGRNNSAPQIASGQPLRLRAGAKLIYLQVLPLPTPSLPCDKALMLLQLHKVPKGLPSSIS